MDKTQLINLFEETGALSFGEFTLSSGRKSSYYLDCRLLTLDARGLMYAVHTIANFLSEFDDYDAIGGPTVGADPIVAALLYTGYARRGFLIRPEAKTHGKGGLFVGPIKSGDQVVLIEDVVTTGGSLMKCVTALRDFGCTVLGACALVDRQAGGKELLGQAGVPLFTVLTAEDLGCTKEAEHDP